MANYREDIMDINLEGGTINRSFINNTIGEGDADGNRFGVRVYRNGEPVNLTGAGISGYFIRADGTTVTIPPGTKIGNKCWVTLPAACYAVEGNFTLSLKIALAGEIITARIVDGTVVNTVSETIVAPVDLIPSVDPDDYDAWVALVEAAAEKIEGITIEETLIAGTRYKIEVATTE